MGKIFMSMAGEGRGHATRAATIVDALADRHEIVLFAPGDALELLRPRYRGTPVEVVPIPGLRFQYDARGRLNYRKTIAAGTRYFSALPRLVDIMRRRIESDAPDLAITDFEPGLPRAALQTELPHICVDHQHFLITSDLSELPMSLRWHMLYMVPIVKSFCRRPDATVVSSFYFPRLKRRWSHVHQVGVLLRPSIRKLWPSKGEGHVCVYFRREADAATVDALARCGRPARIYSRGEPREVGPLSFRRLDVDAFAHDLATCDALVTNAGNQLLGEAMFLGKPILAIPESNNREQRMNAHFLCKSGGGTSVEHLTAENLQEFLGSLDSYRLSDVQRRRVDGTGRTLEIIEQHVDSVSTDYAAAI